MGRSGAILLAGAAGDPSLPTYSPTQSMVGGAILVGICAVVLVAMILLFLRRR